MSISLLWLETKVVQMARSEIRRPSGTGHQQPLRPSPLGRNIQTLIIVTTRVRPSIPSTLALSPSSKPCVPSKARAFQLAPFSSTDPSSVSRVAPKAVITTTTLPTGYSLSVSHLESSSATPSQRKSNPEPNAVSNTTSRMIRARASSNAFTFERSEQISGRLGPVAEVDHVTRRNSASGK